MAGAEAGAGAAAQQPVRRRDDRVEVRAGDRAEQQDQHRQPEHGGGRVLQQLQPDIVRGELLGGDPGADHGGDQQRGADELGQQPPRSGTRGSRRLAGERSA